MLNRVGLLWSGLFVLAAVGHAGAATLDALQGAWAMNGTGCESIFKKTGRGMEFRDRDSSLNTGLIIKGSTILGPLATCKVAQIRRKGDRLSAALNCSDSIIYGNLAVSFRILSPNKFERYAPEFPEISVIYNRCNL